MKRVLGLFLIIIILLSNSIGFAGMDDSYIGALGLDYEKGSQIIVRFKDKKDIKQDFHKGSFLKNSDSYDLNKRTKVINIGDRDIDKVIAEMKLDPSIEYVEKNYTYKLFHSPNDPYYDRLWHMGKIYAEEAWDQTDFDGEVVVAVIDSGIDTLHRDLKNRIFRGGYNFLDNSINAHDKDGHGTFVSGIIAGEINNNYGIAGVAGGFKVKILPLKVTDDKGNANNDDIVRAIDYAIEMGVDVINMSLGGPDYSYFFDEACQRAIDANIVVVAAVGNEGDDGHVLNYPAAYDRVIGVGATDRVDTRASFSNANESVDIVAPGEGIFSTWTNFDLRERGFKYGNGTSYSAPMVSAAAALMKGIDKDLSVGEITNILTSTAIDLGPLGKDIYFGHGLLDMDRAIQEVNIRKSANRFVDFRIMDVDLDKQVEIEFNRPIDTEGLEEGIYASSDFQGRINDIDIDIEINRKNPRKLYIKPKEKWLYGYNFIFLGDQVKDTRGRRLEGRVRIVIRTVNNE